jgi:flagellar biosynthesis component FlhA
MSAHMVYGWGDDNDNEIMNYDNLYDHGLDMFWKEHYKSCVSGCIYGILCTIDANTGIPSISEEDKIKVEALFEKYTVYQEKKRQDQEEKEKKEMEEKGKGDPKKQKQNKKKAATKKKDEKLSNQIGYLCCLDHGDLEFYPDVKYTIL